MKFLQGLILIITGVVPTMIGDVFLKKSQAQDLKFFALGILFYSLGVIPVAFAFKKLDSGLSS